MRLLIVASLLVMASTATAQVPGSLLGQPARVIRQDKDEPTKELAIIEDGVVTGKLLILEKWTEQDWAPFVPEGATAIVHQKPMPGDRYIDGKFTRQFQQTGADGWQMLVEGDVDNPPEPPEVLTPEPWKLLPTYEPTPSEAVKSLKATIDLLQGELDATKQDLEAAKDEIEVIKGEREGVK